MSPQGMVAGVSVEINASRQAVWQALTDPEMIQQYMFGTIVESDWQLGSPIKWKGEWQGRAYEDHGEVLQIEEAELLQYSHISGVALAAGNLDAGHTVTVRLAEQDGVTTVRLAQDGNANHEEVDHAAENWKMMLQGLKNLVEEN